MGNSPAAVLKGMVLKSPAIIIFCPKFSFSFFKQALSWMILFFGFSLVSKWTLQTVKSTPRTFIVVIKAILLWVLKNSLCLGNWMLLLSTIGQRLSVAKPCVPDFLNFLAGSKQNKNPNAWQWSPPGKFFPPGGILFPGKGLYRPSLNFCA